MEENNAYTINARQEPDVVLTKRFVATKIFWNRFNTNNEIIIGTGGSGKTALLRMMEHRLLIQFAQYDRNAKKIIEEKKYIGLYIPTASYFGDLKIIEEMNEIDQRVFFCCAFNILLCKSFLIALESCIKQYFPGEENQKENELTSILFSNWFIEKNTVSSFHEINTLLSNDWLTLQNTIREKVNYNENKKFDLHIKEMNFFSPLQNTIELIRKCLGLTDETTFLILIDEAQFLSEYQKIEINTLLRIAQRPFVFKIATEPYTYTNFRTRFDNVMLRNNQDFQYVAIDELYKERSSQYFKEIIDGIRKMEDKNSILSKLYYSKERTDFTADAARIIGISIEELERIFFTSISDKRQQTVIRERLKLQAIDTKVTRKYLPVFCTKKVWEKYKEGGYFKKSYFYGYDLLLRISEENIRRFYRIINYIQYYSNKQKKMDKAFQNEIFSEYAKLEFTQTINICGKKSFQLLNSICNVLGNEFHNKKYTDDVCTCFKLDQSIVTGNQKEMLELIRSGRIIPENYLSEEEGCFGKVWRISFLFALMLGIHPRKGTPLFINNLRIQNNEIDEQQMVFNWNDNND